MDRSTREMSKRRAREPARTGTPALRHEDGVATEFATPSPVETLGLAGQRMLYAIV